MKGSFWVNVIVGIWLIVAPFALRAAGALRPWTANDLILGILLIAVSWWILAALTPPIGAAWFQILCGIWLIVAPFVLRYSGVATAMANDVICGIIAIVFAAVGSRALARPHALA